ncbi:S9 family peptidase [Luteimonas aestuarii]|nr:S9 family peptidase [Luteimonas aestuarii]
MAPGPAAPAPRPITPADLVQLHQVEAPRFDPAGRRVAYVVRAHVDDADERSSRIRIVPAEGAGDVHEVPTPDGAGDHAPQWSPDGRWLAFLSDRGGTQDEEAATRVWRIPAEGGQAQPVTEAGVSVSSFWWSPDGRRIAYAAEDPRPDPDKSGEVVEVDRHDRFARLWVHDIDTGAARVLTPPRVHVLDAAWSPDGNRFVLRVADAPTINDYWYRSRIVLHDAEGGDLGPTVFARAAARDLAWSPDGTRLLYSELHAHAMSADAIVHDLATGTRTVVAHDWPGTTWNVRWRDASSLVVQGLRGVRSEFLAVDADTGRARMLARVQSAGNGFSVSPDGTIAYVGMASDMPADIWLLRDGDASPLTRSHPQVAQWARGEVRELSWSSSRDGLPIHGVLVLPPGEREGPLPALVQIHGGPAWAWWSGWMGSWHDWGQFLASHGYAVLLPNPRGSEGQGQAFAEASRNDWGGADLQDVLDGVDVLVAEGLLDPARLAIGGWSYGGYLSAMAVARTDRFRTAIVGAGVSDIGAMALTTDTPDYLPGYFGDPVERRAHYDRHSPIRHVGRIAVPMLILHGDRDTRVPLDQGRMLHRALAFQGTPVTMVRYPGARHWLSDRRQETDLLERVLDWLDRHLQAP